MPAKSNAQRGAAAIALSAKKGETNPDKLYGAAKDMYNSMNEKDLEDYAKTENTIRKIVREILLEMSYLDRAKDFVQNLKRQKKWNKEKILQFIQQNKGVQREYGMKNLVFALGSVKENINETFKKGDKVKLRDDVLKRHARRVPAHMGYITNQFKWRDTLRSLKGKTGTIERVFPRSGNVNVQFGKTLIGIESSELVKEGKLNEGKYKNFWKNLKLTKDEITSLNTTFNHYANKGYSSTGSYTNINPESAEDMISKTLKRGQLTSKGKTTYKSLLKKIKTGLQYEKEGEKEKAMSRYEKGMGYEQKIYLKNLIEVKYPKVEVKNDGAWLVLSPNKK